MPREETIVAESKCQDVYHRGHEKEVRQCCETERYDTRGSFVACCLGGHVEEETRKSLWHLRKERILFVNNVEQNDTQEKSHKEKSLAEKKGEDIASS